MQVFQPYVTEWISGSQHILCQRCRQIEASTFATPAADMKDAGLPSCIIFSSCHFEIASEASVFRLCLQADSCSCLKGSTVVQLYAAIETQRSHYFCEPRDLSRKEPHCASGGGNAGPAGPGGGSL